MEKLTRILKTRASVVVLVMVVGYLFVWYIVKNVDILMPSELTSASVKDDFVLVLDAGHGGMDGGCSSADGVSEKGINLNILLQVRDLSKIFGYNVEVTRDSDISIHDKGVKGVGNQKRSDMDNRLAIFNKNPNSLCISIHQNRFTDSKYSGAQMFYADTNPKSEQAAQIIQQQFVKNLQPDNKREIKLSGKELFLCYFCTNPAVMVECGFLSNFEEAELLKTDEYQKKVGFTIFSGINEYVQTQSN